VQHSTATIRRACAIGATVAIISFTTGFGVLSATAAYADEQATSIPTSSQTPTTDASSAPAPTTSAAPPAAAEPGTTTGASATPAADPSPAVSTPADPSPSSTPTTTPTSAAATVSITGDAVVGGTLTAPWRDLVAPVSYTWSSGTTVLPTTTNTYRPTAADAGNVITVTVTSSTDQTVSASTKPVTEPAAFPDASNEDDPILLTATAGEAFTHTFTATGFPKPTYAVTYYPGDDQYASDEDGDAAYLPDGLTLNHTTGVLSGTTDYAGTYAFRITATSGRTTTSQYVNITVSAAAALGVEVTAENKATFLTAHSTSWVIERDGTIWTFQNETSRDGDGYTTFGVGFEGGQPTIDQGGTLLVSGNLVDRFGNYVSEPDGYPAPFTVTSDQPSDVIVANTDPYEGAQVTFPHASTHTLTVTSKTFDTAFTVDVQPTATTVNTTPTTTTTVARGELAYTGTDTTQLLPWAAGLTIAGLALTTTQLLRRRKQH
jgi:hypothetical protein